MQQRSERILKMNLAPADYLRGGLADETERMRKELAGRYSLAMAFRLRECGLTSGLVDLYRERVAAVAWPFTANLERPEHVSIPSEAKSAIARLADEFAGDADPLAELLRAAIPHLSDWRSFGFLLEHIDRIGAQLGVISGPRRTLPARPVQAHRKVALRAHTV